MESENDTVMYKIVKWLKSLTNLETQLTVYPKVVYTFAK